MPRFEWPKSTRSGSNRHFVTSPDNLRQRLRLIPRWQPWHRLATRFALAAIGNPRQGFATLLRLGPARAPPPPIGGKARHVGRNRSAGKDLLPANLPAKATPIGGNLVRSGNSLQSVLMPKKQKNRQTRLPRGCARVGDFHRCEANSRDCRPPSAKTGDVLPGRLDADHCGGSG